MDTSGSVMPGVQVNVYQGEKVVRQAISSPTGDFDIPVDAGEYRLEVLAPDFDTYTEVVRATPELGPLSVTLSLAQIIQQVEVTEERNQLSVESDSSLSTVVLGRDFIDQLPDDEEELAAYLQQIAGSRGGAGRGGSFIIDGFTGGRIPPKDQIQEIRISNSLFSSEFSGVGYGRTEIITRAGTGNFRGQMNFNFKDESLNARNPFNVARDGGVAKRPPSQLRNFQTGASGPIIRNRLTMSFEARHNTNENSGIIRATTLNPDGSLVQHYDPYVTPNNQRGMNIRYQLSLNKNNTLNGNFNFQRNENKNQGLGEFTLMERASDSFNRNRDFNIRETAILGSKMVHEARFAMSSDSRNQTPRNPGLAINVLETFNGGGNPNKSSSSNKDVEFGNLLLYTRSSKWTIKLGTQGVIRRNDSVSENNFLGTWTFSGLADYLAGRPRQFTRNTGDPRMDVRQSEFAAFFQNDFRIINNLNWSFGVRWEDQTNIGDHNNFDPRMGFAYQLGRSTVVRGGIGMFHERFAQNNVEQLLRYDGTRQLSVIFDNPTTYPALPDASQGRQSPPPSLRARAADLVNPYNITTSLSVERNLFANLGMTLSWDNERGVHLYRGRDINAPLPGTNVRPDPTKKVVNQIESTGFSRSNNYTLQLRRQMTGRIQGMMGGSYTLGYVKTNTDGSFSLPVDNYDLSTEWGRSSQNTRHRFNIFGQIRLPWGISTTTQINWSSSRPYNFTTGCDDNGDSTINDRPSLALLERFLAVRSAYTSVACAAPAAAALRRAGTLYLSDLNQQIAGSPNATTITPRNYGNGPGQFQIQLSFNKTVRLRSPESSGPAGPAGNNGGNNFAPPQRGGGGGFGGGGDFGGQRGGDFGGQRGNFPGGQRGGGQRGGNPEGNPNRGNRGEFNQGNGVTMTFNVQIQNLLNHTQLNGYSGTMTSSFFGTANNARNPRQIQAGLRFNF